MKKIYLLLFILGVIQINAQQQFNCYYVQEFLWNSKTEKFDTPVEKSDFSKLKFDTEKNILTHTFEDGGIKTFPLKFKDIEKNASIYKIISPENGYTYIYKIHPDISAIEFFLEKNQDIILLKKYLYK